MSPKHFEVEHGDEEWRQRLSPSAYTVLRQHGTERAFTSPLNKEKRAGTFLCAGCGQALFSSNRTVPAGTVLTTAPAIVRSRASSDIDAKAG